MKLIVNLDKQKYKNIFIYLNSKNYSRHIDDLDKVS